jgi:hypothetical protein
MPLMVLRMDLEFDLAILFATPPGCVTPSLRRVADLSTPNWSTARGGPYVAWVAWSALSRLNPARASVRE